ncbi:isopentenyl transferase family protein [Natranaerofaba carboxydovora]|uniref:isopentenyl transferase family protein n=1 Tax=Natranaerofaba carboxydovora TaxID=2742683 RepID=UPI001F1373E1|nr:isopentenyl transferase family protein [Natranaerofaba carboxydovora]UMZ74837.1 hypothetical protein ACONDI_02441 [Natranaerofaba carboxydovora]
MKIYALYGKSGTGKSHRAVKIAHKYSIPTIIDDGLIIHQGKKITDSKSAKGEKNMIGAIRRAIFENQEYAKKMKEEINNLDTDKILILGTSVNMIYKIIENLDLPEPSIWIDVNELTTPEERKIAKSHRVKGKHVVPLAPTEVSNGIKVPLLGRLKIFLKGEENPRKKSSKKSRITKEQTIVRANYQALGSVYIKENVLYELIKYTLEKDSRVKYIKDIKVHPPKASPVIEAKVALDFDWGSKLQEAGGNISTEITDFVKTTTGIDDLKVVIVISEIAINT